MLLRTAVVIAGLSVATPSFAANIILCKDHPTFKSAALSHSLAVKAQKAGRQKEADQYVEAGWRQFYFIFEHLRLNLRMEVIDDAPSAYEDIQQEQKKGSPGDWTLEKLRVLGTELDLYSPISCAEPPTGSAYPPPPPQAQSKRH